MKERIAYIDFAKGLAIIFVIIGHFIQYSTSQGCNTAIWALIYSFHMPLFMILSGYFISFNIDIRRIAKRFICLIVPGLLWSILIAGVLYVLVTYVHFNNPIENQTFLLRVFKQFWFLSCLFFCYLIGIFSLKIFRNEYVSCIISTLLLMILCTEEHLHIAYLYPYLWVGYFVRKFNLISIISWPLISGLFVTFIILLHWWSYDMTIYALPIKVIVVTDTYISIDIKNILITIYRFVLGLCGSLLIMSLSYKYIRKYSDLQMAMDHGGGKKFASILSEQLCVIGQYTISIYILQKFTLEYAIKFGHIKLSLVYEYILLIPVSIVECYLCVLITKLALKNKFTKVLIGKYS